MAKFIWNPISNKANFGGQRSDKDIKFIVVHWTANTSKGANAMAHRNYFQNNNVYASAHYFVDDEKIVQIVGDHTIAYSVGDNQGHGRALNGCTNFNSISVEMCYNSDSNADERYKLTVELFKALKRKYPHAKVCRHYDVSRKDCPHEFVSDRAKYNKFLSDIEKPPELIINLEKSSDIVVSNKNDRKKKCVMYFRDGNKITAEFIAQQLKIPVFKDDGKELPNSEHKNWDILYIGDLGKNRIETAKIAIKKYLK